MYIYIYSKSLPILITTNILVSSTSWLFWSVALNLGVQESFQIMVSLCEQAQEWECQIIWCSIWRFKGTVKLLSIAPHSNLYFPNQSRWVPFFPSSSQSIFFIFFLMMFILNGGRVGHTTLEFWFAITYTITYTITYSNVKQLFLN